MVGTDRASRARVRSLERRGSDLADRGQLWLWNRTTAFPAKEPSFSEQIFDRTYSYVSELLDVLEVEILAGDRPTVVDCTTFTIFQTAREPFDLLFGDGHPRLNAWYRRFRSRPSADY